MNSINIFGRLVRDPELKAYTNAKGETSSLCNFSVAVNRKLEKKPISLTVPCLASELR